MKSKNKNSKKNQDKSKSKYEDKKPKKQNKKEEKKENKDIVNNNNNSEEGSKKELKKPSAWIFIQGRDLQGFHTTFILMIVIPISVFFIIRNILNKFNFTRNQQDTYGVVGVIISVYFILISYIIYYFKNDFYAFFCQKNEKDKTKTE